MIEFATLWAKVFRDVKIKTFDLCSGVDHHVQVLLAKVYKIMMKMLSRLKQSTKTFCHRLLIMEGIQIVIDCY